jgi:hypothetical protein
MDDGKLQMNCFRKMSTTTDLLGCKQCILMTWCLDYVETWLQLPQLPHSCAVPIDGHCVVLFVRHNGWVVGMSLLFDNF